MYNKDLARVSQRIGSHVKEFCTPGRQFRMQELNDFVNSRIEEKIAPDSPGRILRQLRKSGELSYVLLSRSESMYEIPKVLG